MRDAWEFILAWITEHETLFIFFAILFEEGGIPMPLPADLAMALAGYRVAQGQMSLLEAFAIGQVATLLGSSCLYWVGRRGGRAILFRYARLLHISPQRLNQAERLVTRSGPLAVIVGRQIPGLRMVTPLACGIFHVPYRIFLPAMFVGSSVYIGAFLALGMWGGPAALTAFREGGLPLRLLASTVMLVGAAFVLRLLDRRAREVISPVHRYAASRRRSLEAALISGLGASALTTLSVTWLLEMIGFVAQAPPERALLRFLETDPTSGLFQSLTRYAPQRLVFTGLVATIPFQVATHLLWAVLYAFTLEQRLRGGASARGVQFAVLPWLFSGLVVFPLLNAGWFGFQFGGVLPMAGELIRSVLFGVTLATLYRLVRLARQPRSHDGHRHGHRHQPVTSAAPEGITPTNSVLVIDADQGLAVPASPNSPSR